MYDLARFEYGLKWWAKMGYAALGLFTAIAGVICTIVAFAVREFESWSYWRGCLLSVAFLTMGLFFLAYAFRSRLAFDGTRISIRYSMREKSADISEIESYGIKNINNFRFWRLDLKSGESLLIRQAFEVDDAFSDFLAHLREVDDRDPISLGLSG
jgi:hypothetical protein